VSRPGGARAAAARVVERTLASRSPAERWLARESAALADARDRRLLSELAYGALRWKLRLEHVLERASGRELAKIDPALRPVLAVAALQLLFLDRVPAHAAVSEAVDEVRRRRGAAAAGFANAVLRKLAAAPRLDDWPVEERDAGRRRAIESSHPPALVGRWLDRFGAEATDRILAADNAPRELHLLAFADRGGRDALAAALAGEGVETAPGEIATQALRVTAGNPLGGEAFARGDFYVQDQASQAAACVPAPAPGERVLDAAAAPGGKGLAVLAREPAARVCFADLSLERGRLLRDNARRLRRELPLVVADAARPAFAAGAFDRVVVDAPCTGTGTLRRHPELRWRYSADELARLAERGLEMLLGIADAVAPGGRLIHVTCSIEAEENEAVAERFLARRPDFVDDPLESSSLETDAGRRAEGRWRVLPDRAHDGFSVAVLRRRK
jgi:16S rRNA (cytosine967-C5)-methyltransferase